MEQVGFDWVRPGLALGGCIGSQTAADLARTEGLRLVVDLRDEACDDPEALAEAGIELLHLPTPDNQPIAADHLHQGLARARQVLAEGRSVLVHCQHGIGRSALLTLCLLVEEGLSPIDALRQIKDARERVSPSCEQYEAWADWLRRRGHEPPSFEAFASVAYRHLPRA